MQVQNIKQSNWKYLNTIFHITFHENNYFYILSEVFKNNDDIKIMQMNAYMVMIILLH